MRIIIRTLLAVICLLGAGGAMAQGFGLGPSRGNVYHPAMQPPPMRQHGGWVNPQAYAWGMRQQEAHMAYDMKMREFNLAQHMQGRPSGGGIVWVQPQQMQPRYVVPPQQQVIEGVVFTGTGWDYFRGGMKMLSYNQFDPGTPDGGVFVDICYYHRKVWMPGADFQVFFHQLMDTRPEIRQQARATLAQLAIDQGIAEGE